MYLENKRVYLSGPIEYDSSKLPWREEALETLKEFGLDIFDPHADPKQQWVPQIHAAKDKLDFDTVAKIAKSFVRKDLCMVDRSDILIAYLPHKVPTTGTVHEIINAVNAKKPVLLVCPQGKINVPVWYYGFIPHEVMFSSFTELRDYLREVDLGKYTENNRWSYVYGLV